jgi:uncharacterized membrane protein YagU involved in acid resistance
VSYNKPGIAKSIVAGAIGGLAASFAMNAFQSIVSQVEKAGPPKGDKGVKSDDATVKTAQAISSKLLLHNLDESEKKWAGPLVHYAFGTATGAFYGLLAGRVPQTDAARGTAYGTAVWLGADEVAVPAFGLAGKPEKTPISGHLKALASHLVYGFVTDAVRRAILKS